MSDADLTFESLFLGHGPNSVAGETALAEVRKRFQKELPKVAWNRVAGEIDARAGEALSTKVEDILGAAWAQVERLREYSDPELHPPEETVEAPLVDHTVESSHAPEVAVLIDDSEVATLNFTIQLELRIEGCVLEVRDGRIRKVQSGICRIAGSLACVVNAGFSSHPLYERSVESREYAITGDLDLGEGVPLAGRAS